jgi:hypothetical protein
VIQFFRLESSRKKRAGADVGEIFKTWSAKWDKPPRSRKMVGRKMAAKACLSTFFCPVFFC